MFETKAILVLKMVFSIKERVFIYKIYLLNNSCDRVREEFTGKFGKKRPKNATIIDIKKISKKLEVLQIESIIGDAMSSHQRS
jgi:hypothetical protein